MELADAGGFIDRLAEEDLQRDGLGHMGQHGAPPDQLAFAFQALLHAADLDFQQPWGDLPEPRRVHSRRDASFTKRPEV